MELKLSKFTPMIGSATPNLYEKELIYAGSFDDGSNTIEIAKEVIDYWAIQLSKYQEKGIEVFLPDEHTTDPSEAKAKLVSSHIREKEGRYSLFGRIQFNDKETADKYKGHDVSIYAPPKGNGFVYPIEHVALTKVPVVPDLGVFEAIAASFGRNKVSKIIDLAKKIGLEVKENATEDEVAELLIVEFSKNPIEDLAKELEISFSEGKANTAILTTFKELKEKKVEKTEPIKFSRTMLDLAKENREGKLEKLVEAGAITPAVKDKLAVEFCKDEALSFSLQEDGNSDVFNAVIAALNENEKVISFSSRTTAQQMVEGDNSLVANAEKRAEKAKKQ